MAEIGFRAQPRRAGPPAQADQVPAAEVDQLLGALRVEKTAQSERRSLHSQLLTFIEYGQDQYDKGRTS